MYTPSNLMEVVGNVGERKSARSQRLQNIAYLSQFLVRGSNGSKNDRYVPIRLGDLESVSTIDKG